MSWTLRLVDASASPKVVGDVWFAQSPIDRLSFEYRKDGYGKRPPVFIRFPGPVDVCLDQQVDDGHGHGWRVRGTAPSLSVTPSVNVVGIYHGFVLDGVISDDCEGREFHPDGTPLPRF